MLGALLALVQLVLIARVRRCLDGLALDRVAAWHRWNGIACLACSSPTPRSSPPAMRSRTGSRSPRRDRPPALRLRGRRACDVGLVALWRGRRDLRHGDAPPARPARLAGDPRHRLRRGRAGVQPSARHRPRVPAPAGRPRVLVGAVRRHAAPRSSGCGSCGPPSARCSSTTCRSSTWRRARRASCRRDRRAATSTASAPVRASTCTGASSPAGTGRTSGRCRCRAAPDGRRLRVTARERGGAPALRSLAPGTRVIAEGPAGGLTSAARRSPRIALIAGGPGLAPVRALLQETPGDVAVVCRGDGGTFAADLDALARDRGAEVHYVPGDGALSPSACARSCPTSPSATSSSPARPRWSARRARRCAARASRPGGSRARGSARDGPRARPPRRAGRGRDRRRRRAAAERPRAAARAAGPAAAGAAGGADDEGDPRREQPARAAERAACAARSASRSRRRSRSCRCGSRSPAASSRASRPSR